MMELRDLEYFLACVEERNVTRAAARVHAAQPTLSHALARLESELGERLLERRPRQPVRVTEAGAVVERRAREMLGAVAALREDLGELRGARAGSLRVAAIQSLSATVLPRVLAAHASRYPGVRLEVKTAQAERIPKLVATGRADVGLVAGAPRAALRGLRARRLFEEPLELLVRRTDALAKRPRVPLAVLAERELLLVPDGTFTSDIVHEACEAAGFTPNVRLTLASAEALRETVRAGLGVTILPRGYLAPHDRDLVAVPLVRPTPRREVLLVERGAGAMPTPRSAGPFVDLLLETVRRSEPARSGARRRARAQTP